jgi:hypothetical protein
MARIAEKLGGEIGVDRVVEEPGRDIVEDALVAAPQKPDLDRHGAVSLGCFIQ